MWFKLITDLQNIDANFARANQILSSKILPSFKRFATSTEPVRNAARVGAILSTTSMLTNLCVVLEFFL